MPWSAGTFSITGDPLVDGEIAEATGSSTALQPKFDDIADGITDTLHTGGQNSPTANIPFGGFKITGLAAGSTAGDSVRYEQVMLLAGATMTGALVLDNDGDATTPDLAFAGDLNTGIYSSAADTINITTGGTVRLTLNTTQLTLSGSQLLGDNAASASAPDYSFDGDSNTGMYSAGADQINWTTGGTLRKSLSTTAETNTLVTLGPDGSASAPTYSFTNDSNSGMYTAGSDTIRFATGGTFRIQIGFTGVLLWNSSLATGVQVGDGTNAAPSLSFANDTDCGPYRIGSDNIGMAIGGSLISQWDSAGIKDASGVLYKKAGKQTIPILASAMTSRTTNGAAAGTTEGGTNRVMLVTKDFDASTDEFVQIMIPMPKSWNESTVTAQFIWTAANTGNVIWGAQGVALSDDDPFDGAFGTAQTVTDGVTAANDVMISSETSAITIGGTPAEGDLVCFQFYRDADAGGDTCAVDAKLIAVRLFFTDNAQNDT